MKYIVLLGDGMADEPVEALGGKTPLQAADTPNMDRLARSGRVGLVHTVPEGFHPGSDVANLSVFGYDPRRCYSGRSPIEAASMGIELGENDVAFRLNLVYLVANYGKLYMADFSAGHISTEEGKEIVESLQAELGDEVFQFYPGVSYRHLLVWRGGKDKMHTAPPHDLTGRSIEDSLPTGEGAAELVDLMNSSQMLLKRHPVNLRREEKDLPSANSIWLWGQGRAPKLETYADKFGVTGAVISAVDLIKGIGVYAGLDIIEVPGATGYLDTNYRGKAEYALEALKSRDFVYLHVEAPDEAAHGGMLEEKIRAIENFDRDVVGIVAEGIGALGDYRILVLPDHPTPVEKMTHTSDAVPFILYGSDAPSVLGQSVEHYDEASAASTDDVVEDGHSLIVQLLKG
ncbi:MAG TPA: cofactor-independent phosphoglycerate mutase [Desulfuromonadales bacterium]|nr:cofactor-independent phosphoglycerate mutase [Desulfuromonadales bacterium]